MLHFVDFIKVDANKNHWQGNVQCLFKISLEKSARFSLLFPVNKIFFFDSVNIMSITSTIMKRQKSARKNVQFLVAYHQVHRKWACILLHSWVFKSFRRNSKVN